MKYIYNTYICIYIIFYKYIYAFQSKGDGGGEEERRKRTERDTMSFHVLAQFSNGHKSPVQVWPKQGARYPIWVSDKGIQGPAAFPGTFSTDFIRTGLAETQTRTLKKM